MLKWRKLSGCPRLDGHPGCCMDAEILSNSHRICWVCIVELAHYLHLLFLDICHIYIYISIAASSSYVHQQWHLNFHSSEHSVAKWKHAIQTYEWQFFHWKKKPQDQNNKTRISDLYCNGSWFSLPSLRMNMELQHGKVQALSPDPCIVQCVDCLTSCGFCNFHYLICWISINQCGFKQPRCPGSIWSSCAKRISKHAPTQATLANQCQCLATGTDHFFACVRIPALGTKVAEASNLIQYKFLYVCMPAMLNISSLDSTCFKLDHSQRCGAYHIFTYFWTENLDDMLNSDWDIIITPFHTCWQEWQ